ncbi:DotH/IcmK family type IV secretion protein [Mesorhizobium sp. SP-1A]|uniref:DotH/IcmK family type IV secretion protein n=1 Tax=Mesorhizobium sp. SP-1A TaxID=3077840 RepID=UPI0028F6C270|nr:DotH/IcmK family type IV secretion protein [Mesorhizobium sp. SP-1A]
MKLSKKALSATIAIALSTTMPVFAQDGSDLLLPPASFPQSSGASAAAPTPVVGSPIENVDPSDATFQEALKHLAPLTPGQIKQMRQVLDGVDKATGMPLSPINPITRSIKVSLKSGERPASLKVSPGWVSTLTFSDVTGQPWPVLSIVNGNPDAYHVQKSVGDESTNIVTISSKQAYVPTNIAINLAGAKVPVVMTLSPSAGEVDFRVDAQMDQRGPNAAYDTVGGSSLAPTNDSVMLGFLDGVPPEGARKLKTTDRDVQAWRYDDMLYVRTSKPILSPAFVAKQQNASGVHVFVLKEAPVLIVSDAGRSLYVKIDR